MGETKEAKAPEANAHGVMCAKPYAFNTELKGTNQRAIACAWRKNKHPIKTRCLELEEWTILLKLFPPDANRIGGRLKQEQECLENLSVIGA